MITGKPYRAEDLHSCGSDARAMTMNELLNPLWCSFLMSVKDKGYSTHSLKCTLKNLPDFMYF